MTASMRYTLLMRTITDLKGVSAFSCCGALYTSAFPYIQTRDMIWIGLFERRGHMVRPACRP